MRCNPSAVVVQFLRRGALACSGGPDCCDIRTIRCGISNGTTPENSRTCDQYICPGSSNQRRCCGIDTTVNLKVDRTIPNQRP